MLSEMNSRIEDLTEGQVVTTLMTNEELAAVEGGWALALAAGVAAAAALFGAADTIITAVGKLGKVGEKAADAVCKMTNCTGR